MTSNSNPRTRTAYPPWLRISLGTAIVLGLAKGKLQARPTTAYLMTYNPNKCSANCSFCPQARESRGSASMLSRVSWPVFRTGIVIKAINESFRRNETKRVCVQALNYPKVFDHIVSVVTRIQDRCEIPISVSCQPSGVSDLRKLARAGVQRIGIPLDAAAEDIFDYVKGQRAGGPYRWKKQFRMLKEALYIFGEGNVSTHLMVGLGETEREMVRMIQECINIGVLPALFAFTPIRGTRMQDIKPPPIQKYRRIQTARFLILSKASKFESMRFAQGHLTDFGISGNVLRRIIGDGEAFRTSGCPDCNRPYYNERPTGPLYNYPSKPEPEEILEIEKQIGPS
jgi:biotin synthase-related radical SAM superfamily protein